MIKAVLQGKSLGYEHSEDILTSTVIGTLQYLPANTFISFIESAFLYDKEKIKLWQQMKADYIELRCYKSIKYIFWAWHPKYGEPDLIVIFSDHVHGEDDALFLIEAKFKSGKSSHGEYDQLKRYYKAINEDIEGFEDSNISNFIGRKYLIYLTEAEAYLDIQESNKQIKISNSDYSDDIFHLRWHELRKVIMNMYEIYSPLEKTVASDLIDYLEKLGLWDFSGIKLPTDRIVNTVSKSYPIFYNNTKIEFNICGSQYFGSLPDNINTEINGSIFYKGGA